MSESDALGIRVREGERACNLTRGLWRSPRHMEHSPGEVLSRFSGVTLHGSLGVPPRIRTSRDRPDFTVDLPILLVSIVGIRLFAISLKFPSADEILYLILQVEAGRGRMPGRIVEQAELVLVLLWHLPPQRCRGAKVNLAP